MTRLCGVTSVTRVQVYLSATPTSAIKTMRSLMLPHLAMLFVPSHQACTTPSALGHCIQKQGFSKFTCPNKEGKSKARTVNVHLIRRAFVLAVATYNTLRAYLYDPVQLKQSQRLELLRPHLKQHAGFMVWHHTIKC